MLQVSALSRVSATVASVARLPYGTATRGQRDRARLGRDHPSGGGGCEDVRDAKGRPVFLLDIRDDGLD